MYHWEERNRKIDEHMLSAFFQLQRVTVSNKNQWSSFTRLTNRGLESGSLEGSDGQKQDGDKLHHLSKIYVIQI